jgi:glycerol kinase
MAHRLALEKSCPWLWAFLEEYLPDRSRQRQAAGRKIILILQLRIKVAGMATDQQAAFMPRQQIRYHYRGTVQRREKKYW